MNLGAPLANWGAGGRVGMGRALASFAVVALLIASLSCNRGSDQGPGGPVAETVSGLIRQVDSRSLLKVRSLTVEDDSGTRWVFEADQRFDDFTPSHLREHMVLGLRVAVTFHRDEGRLIIDALSD